MMTLVDLVFPIMHRLQNDSLGAFIGHSDYKDRKFSFRDVKYRSSV